MKIPVTLRLAVLTVLATAFYTYVGQLVPQKEVHPEKETEVKADLSTGEMVKLGKQIFEGKGQCSLCHTIGRTSGPLRFPDLAGVGGRAATRVPGLGDVAYLAQSVYAPDAFVVPGFNPGMPVINKPPIGLTDQEILTVIAYLQSLGGQASVSMKTRIEVAGSQVTVSGGEGGEAAAGETAAAPAGGEVAAIPGEALYQQYACGSCHDAEPAAAGKGPRLPPARARLKPAAVLTQLMVKHRAGELGDAVRATGFYDRATLEEVHEIVAFLTAGEPGR